MKGCLHDPERREVRVLRRCVPLEGAAILEVGCGSGRLTRRISGPARSVVAIDPDAALIARAKASTPASVQQKVHYRAGDAENPPISNQRFDLAILSWSL